MANLVMINPLSLGSIKECPREAWGGFETLELLDGDSHRLRTSLSHISWFSAGTQIGDLFLFFSTTAQFLFSFSFTKLLGKTCLVSVSY